VVRKIVFQFAAQFCSK